MAKSDGKDPVQQAAEAELTTVNEQVQQLQAELGQQIASLQAELDSKLAPLIERQGQLQTVLATLRGERPAPPPRKRAQRAGVSGMAGGPGTRVAGSVREQVLAAVRAAGTDGINGATIAQQTGRSAGAVRGHLSTLEEEGVLRREGQQAATRYFIA